MAIHCYLFNSEAHGKLNQTNCVFLPFDHCHLCIKPPLVTRASGADMGSRHKGTCRNCSMIPQYHTSIAKAPTWHPTKVRDRADRPSIIWVGSSCFESYSNRLHAAVWWKVCLTRCFRLESDPKIEWYRLDLVDYISHWLSSGTQDEVNTENLGKSMFQLKNKLPFHAFVTPWWGFINHLEGLTQLLLTEGTRKGLRGEMKNGRWFNGC